MDPESIGPYRVESRLGRGGMGAVYKAWDERLRRWVAIKSVEPDRPLTAERRERLQREARAVAGLSHPAVAQVHDILCEGERDFIVMEYVRGRSLASTLLDGPLATARALELAGQIASGLSAAHSRGVVHRDLKAENIMITDEGKAKILDFGLAKRLDPDDPEESLTEDGVVMGTTRAMSPEQAQGEELDHRSDLFSLGSLLYEMVTGRHPFQSSSPVATMERVVRRKPPPVRRINPRIPEPLELLIEQLLEKDPDDRPADADQVAQALEALARRIDTPQEHDDPLRRLTARARRRRLWRSPWLIAVLAALAAALAVALMLLV